MYAIVDVKDKQFKVRENDTLYVPYHADADVDETLTLDRVLLLSNGDGDTTLGTPTVDGATVSARVVDHVKGDKVIVFKKKRRKRYRVKKGHRQQYTQIHIESLNADGAAPPPAEDDSDEPAEDESPAAAETADAETADAESPESEAPETEAEDVETADAADAGTEEVEATEAPGEASEAAEETAENDETEDAESDDEESEGAESEGAESDDEEKDDDAK